MSNQSQKRFEEIQDIAQKSTLEAQNKTLDSGYAVIISEQNQRYAKLPSTSETLLNSIKNRQESQKLDFQKLNREKTQLHIFICACKKYICQIVIDNNFNIPTQEETELLKELLSSTREQITKKYYLYYLLLILNELDLNFTSLRKLNEPADYQTIGSLTRKIMEQVLDAEHLKTHLPEYIMYEGLLRRYKMKDLDLFKSDTNIQNLVSSIQPHLVKIEERYPKLFTNGRIVDKWHGKSVDQLCKDLPKDNINYEELYNIIYRLTSWHLHSGITGTSPTQEGQISYSHIFLLHCLILFLRFNTILVEAAKKNNTSLLSFENWLKSKTQEVFLAPVDWKNK